MALELFHPAVARWFARELGTPSEPQKQGWPSIRAEQNTLIAAPTGSGKTLAAFLSVIDDLIRSGIDGTLRDETRVVYVSPLKALSNDIEKNLRLPLAGIRGELKAMGIDIPEIRVAVRTGDTPAKERAAALKTPPHIFVTTPESLYILLTTERGRALLKTAKTVIVDEIHALVRDKRGAHLALSLERLDALAGRKLVRVGLSATQRPMEDVAHFLAGTNEPCTIVDAGHQRLRDLAIEVPGSPLEAVMSNETWEEIYDRIAELVRQHKSTLIFVNTRRVAERLTRHLSERLGHDRVMSHHGSLARETRLLAEQRLKDGELCALVATASLELGIDIGAVDLVCQVGSTRSIAAFLQRVGRSGHSHAGVPKGRIFPLSRDELVEAAALLDAVRRDELDRTRIPESPLDIVAQQIVAEVACEEWDESRLYERIVHAYPFRNLSRERFLEIVQMLADGFTTRRGRRAAHIHRDAVHGKLRARRGTRLIAVTCGGAIPDNADYEVRQAPASLYVGSINEDFAIESTSGDIFQLGNTSWRILRVEPGVVHVEDAHGAPPSLPFWLGEAPSRTEELSHAVSALRKEVDTRGADAQAWLTKNVGIGDDAASQIVEYLIPARDALSAMPSEDTIVVERFFDEGGSMHLVLHAPFGSRLNRAWGLALRKRFCQSFNFELQAAATEDAVLLSLGPTHSFPIEDVFRFLRSTTVRDVLTQALLDSPMFATRWRWNAGRALAILRARGGKRRPARFLRMDADDLLTLVFPDQVACAENLAGPREIPDHPLVAQTVADCLHEAMDIDGLESLLRSIEQGERKLVARDLTEASPFAAEILTARPYAFLDDAPLEERRAQAVMNRRYLDSQNAHDLGALDPAAIERVRDEAWPDAGNADELHDALLITGALTQAEGEAHALRPLFEVLIETSRATTLHVGAHSLWVAREKLTLLHAVHPEAVRIPDVSAIQTDKRAYTRESALVELVRGRLEVDGPTTSELVAAKLAVSTADAEMAMLALEAEGFAMRGQFTSAGAAVEWCDRRLLARIHRYTLDRLRREIEPVSTTDFMRYLFEWHRVGSEVPAEGPESLRRSLLRLEGFEAAASSWESEILSARVRNFDPAWLDALCLSGEFTFRRVGASSSQRSPVRSTPIAWLMREHLSAFQPAQKARLADVALSSPAQVMLDALASGGALFFSELMARTKLLRAQAEQALGELVATGRVSSDSPAGLRALLQPAAKRDSTRLRRNGFARDPFAIAGRWSLLDTQASETDESATEVFARVLLTRYGVVFKKLLERESLAPPWRELLRVLRRMEARGEIRGGRFVERFTGEQYALPEAVAALRAVRKKPRDDAYIALSAADPLNLVGILLPGARVPATASNRVLFQNGELIAIREGKEVSFLKDDSPESHWRAQRALLTSAKRRVPTERAGLN